MTVAEAAWVARFAERAEGELGGHIAEIMALSGSTDVITLSGGFPDPATFPGQALAEAVSRVLADPIAQQYAPTAGLPGFRSWLAGRLADLEGLRPGEDQLLVTSGGIEGLELIAKTLLDPGDAVVVEAPSYLGAIMAFRGFQAEVHTVPMDGDGLLVDRLAELFALPRVKLLYTVPDYQNPAGVTLAAERRPALVELARRHGVLVVEDVAYRELGFSDLRHPSLWSLGPDVVAQLGTFSKTFMPGFRMGWVAGPARLVARLVLAKQNSDQCTGAFGQRLLEEYARAGRLDEQVVTARRLYARRCAALLAALERHLPDDVRWTRPDGGFFTWLTVPDEVDLVAAYPRALQAGVAYVPGLPFYPDGRGRSQLRLSFSKVDDAAIDEGVRRLAGVIGEARAAR